MSITRKLFMIARMLLAAAVLAGLFCGSSQPAEAASQINIYGPVGSGKFGATVTVLPNGNFVVTDPTTIAVAWLILERCTCTTAPAG